MYNVLCITYIKLLLRSELQAHKVCTYFICSCFRDSILNQVYKNRVINAGMNINIIAINEFVVKTRVFRIFRFGSNDRVGYSAGVLNRRRDDIIGETSRDRFPQLSQIF